MNDYGWSGSGGATATATGTGTGFPLHPNDDSVITKATVAANAAIERKHKLESLVAGTFSDKLIRVCYPEDEWLTPEHYLIARQNCDDIQREEIVGMPAALVAIFIPRFCSDILQRRRNNLTSLRLEMCRLDDVSCERLGRTLKLPKLRVLELVYCGIDGKLIQPLLEGLVENETIMVLNLDGNPLGELGGRSLLRCIRANANLPVTASSVSIEGTGIPEAVRIEIALELSRDARLAVHCM